MNVEREIEALRARWPDEFRDGARVGFLRRFNGAREAGGFPAGFHAWPLERKNAWYSGHNVGRLDRLRDSDGAR